MFFNNFCYTDATCTECLKYSRKTASNGRFANNMLNLKEIKKPDLLYSQVHEGFCFEKF